jgi:hypothetical protein
MVKYRDITTCNQMRQPIVALAYCGIKISLLDFFKTLTSTSQMKHIQIASSHYSQ